jgi:enoyl-CoA hydratase/carnithine racemase
MASMTDPAQAAQDELVHLAVADGVATITLDSPHNRNALSRRLVTELLERLDAADADPSARVVVLRSSGRVFCSGADLSEASTVGMEEGSRAMVAMQRRVVALGKPVVAVVAGPVRAGGIGLVAASDVVVAAEESSFALTEVKLGLAPAVISLTVLPRMTGRAAALTFLGGATFGGAEAAAHGLVTTVVPGAALDAEVDRVVAELATGSPQGLLETKRLLAAPLLERIDAYGEEMGALSARLFASDAAKEAMTAFLTRGR